MLLEVECAHSANTVFGCVNMLLHVRGVQTLFGRGAMYSSVKNDTQWTLALYIYKHCIQHQRTVTQPSAANDIECAQTELLFNIFNKALGYYYTHGNWQQ